MILEIFRETILQFGDRYEEIEEGAKRPGGIESIRKRSAQQTKERDDEGLCELRGMDCTKKRESVRSGREDPGQSKARREKSPPHPACGQSPAPDPLRRWERPGRWSLPFR